ncbi:unnamed protein product [Rhizophagus irregularis]|nr:unnamed protein product [Rhizophagus irregularis]
MIQIIQNLPLSEVVIFLFSILFNKPISNFNIYRRYEVPPRDANVSFLYVDPSLLFWQIRSLSLYLSISLYVCGISGLCLRPSEPLLSIDVQSIRRLLGIFRNGSYDKSLFVVYSSNEVCNILQFQNLRRLLLLCAHNPRILLWKPDVKSAASDNSNITTVLVVGESAASKKIDHMSEFLWKCCVTIECLQRGIKQICGLCKMVRRSLSARDARILLWKSDVKSAASDNSIGLMVAIVTKFAGYLYSEKACRSRMSIELL